MSEHEPVRGSLPSGGSTGLRPGPSGTLRGASRAPGSAPRAPGEARRGRPTGARRPAAGLAAGVALVLLALGGAPTAAAGQDLPQGVTEEMVEQGREVFRGDGFCYTCHGRDGTGVSGAGGDLTDGEWRHTDGSFAGLVDRIRSGVRANASSTGVPMPPAGGAELSPDQLRAVAAYVLTLSRGGG